MNALTSTDEVLVRRAAWNMARRVAAVVALAMLLLVTLVTLVVVRGQAAAADRELRTASRTADDVGDPPPGAWLLLSRGGHVRASPGLPADLSPRLADLRTRAVATARLVDVRTADGDSFRVATLTRSGQVIQVVLDTAGERAQRNRLLQTMAAASACALVLSAGLGVVLGRRAVQPFAEALELQRTFVADASHELRTPLTLLSTRAQLLHAELTSGAFPAPLVEDSASVVTDVHRLGSVLDDLLAAADPHSDADVELLDLAALSAAAVDSASAHARSIGVEVQAPVVDDAGHPVLGAPAALRRAVLSLVDNALDHTPPGGTVRVAIRRDGADVVVEVSDTGTGVPAAAVPLIFRRFHSGGQRSGRRHYGLGLALANDVANRHGGRLELLDPVAGQGATFALRLPAAR